MDGMAESNQSANLVGVYPSRDLFLFLYSPFISQFSHRIDIDD